MGLWSFFLLSTLIALAKGHHHYERCSSVYANDYELKQHEIQDLVDLINKPVRPAYQDFRNVLNERDLNGLGRLPHDEVFSLFDERNWDEATQVIRLLTGAPSYENFLERAHVILPRVNEDLFLYCLSVALTLRPDTRGVHVPRVLDVYPDKFLSRDVIVRLKEVTRFGQYRDQVPIIDGTRVNFNSQNPNYELDYFLRDPGLNAHHYHWHVQHSPLLGVDTEHPDRQGEYFSHMHQQMVARFDTERISVKLPRVSPFENWNEPIQEGNAPNLVIDKTGYRYAYRPPGLVLQDLPNVPRSRMIQWRNRLVQSIQRGYLFADNQTRVNLTSDRGIDILGNAIESNRQSVNHDFYGNLHGCAHVIAGRITSPRGAPGERNGAMYDVATSAQDPLFYSWHKYIDNIFQELKELQSYSREELLVSDFQVNQVRVRTVAGDYANTVRTYWQNSLYPIGQGFTFTQNSRALVKIRHLNHEPYYYEITVTNTAQQNRFAAVRIFGSVINDERGQPLTLNNQRRLIIELDKFVVPLQPGENIIRRSANQSSVTVPEDSFYASTDELPPYSACHCGWPQYLLLPRGQYEGLPFRIFVVVTNWEQDRVSDEEQCLCADAVSYCGSPGQSNPDGRALGYPFDRHIQERNFSAFQTQNMGSTDINIRFTGEYLPSSNVVRRQLYGCQQYGGQQYGRQQYGGQQYGGQQYGCQQYGGQQYGNQQFEVVHSVGQQS